MKDLKVALAGLIYRYRERSDPGITAETAELDELIRLFRYSDDNPPEEPEDDMEPWEIEDDPARMAPGQEPPDV